MKNKFINQRSEGCPVERGVPFQSCLSPRAAWCTGVPTVPPAPAGGRCHLPKPSWKMNGVPVGSSPALLGGCQLLRAPR